MELTSNMTKEILSGDELVTDADFSLRPAFLQDFVGQEHIKSNLSVFIQAAQNRKEALDHTLFYGPPGLGKTSLAHIVSREMGIPGRLCWYCGLVHVTAGE